MSPSDPTATNRAARNSNRTGGSNSNGNNNSNNGTGSRAEGDVPGRLAAALRRRLPPISPAGYRRVLAVSLFLVAFIIFSGAVVRLTNSGLGCPQWPTCSVGEVLRAPNNHGRIELFNRYLTGWIAFIVVLLGLSSVLRRPYRRGLVQLSWLLLVGVVGQAILGGITVLMKLKPQAVMGHFLLSIALLSAALVLYERASQDMAPAPWLDVPVRLAWLTRLLVVLASLTVFMGTIVTSSGPHGGDDIAKRFNYSMKDVARLHSTAAWGLVACTLAIAWAFRSAATPGRQRVQRRVGQLLIVTMAQGVIGYVQYFTRVPAWLVGIHIIGVVLVWCACLRVAFPLWSPTAQTARPSGWPAGEAARVPG